MSEPLRIIPIPFIDFTQSVESFAPTGVFAIHTDASQILHGFVMPIPVVVAQFVAACFSQFILNPFLYHQDILNTWEPGMDVRVTMLRNSLDFWMSFGYGRSFAFAILGLGTIASMLWARRRRQASEQAAIGAGGTWKVPPGRGDFPLWATLLIWALGMAGYVYVVHRLIPNFPLAFLLGFGFLYTPLNSYISARTFGIMSRDLFDIPYIREATFILSKYDEIDIWFAPFPNEDYGNGDGAVARSGADRHHLYKPRLGGFHCMAGAAHCGHCGVAFHLEVGADPLGAVPVFADDVAHLFDAARALDHRPARRTQRTAAGDTPRLCNGRHGRVAGGVRVERRGAPAV